MHSTEILFEAAFMRAAVPTLIVDSGARVVAANDAYVAMSARSRDELIGAYSVEFMHADDLPVAAAHVDRLLGREVRTVRQRRRIRRGDGTWAEALAVTSLLPVGDAWYLLVEFPEHTAIDAPDPVDELQARAVLGPFGDLTSFHDIDGAIVFTPAALADRLGRTAQWLYGRRLTDPALRAVTFDGEPLTAEHDPIAAALATGDDVVRTIGLTTADGRQAWYSIRAGLVHGGVMAVRSTWHPVDALVEAERALARQLDVDDLTGLATRRALIDQVERTLADGGPVSIVFVDLDGFKDINDELGHLAGDEVLAAAAAALSGLAPAGSSLGRAGGDEFVLMTASGHDAEAFAEAVRRRSDGPDGLVTVRGRTVRASAGVGIGQPGDDRAALFTRADAAMYRAKRRNREATRVG